MWMVGDWGQASPWSRGSGVLMTKGDDDVYTGELSLPKGTKFAIKILKSTVSTTSGGDNAWSAVRYESTLHNSESYDFGEFTDNLIPNGTFEEGAVKWTPSDCILMQDFAISGDYILAIGEYFPSSATSDTFVIPPRQNLKLSGYVGGLDLDGSVVIEVKDVDTQSVLFKTVVSVKNVGTWEALSGTFKTGSLPVTAQVVCTNRGMGPHAFDNLSLVMP